MKKHLKSTPLGQLEDVEELKERYRVFSDEVLGRWVETITGPHREAIAAILGERKKGEK